MGPFQAGKGNYYSLANSHLTIFPFSISVNSLGHILAPLHRSSEFYFVLLLLPLCFYFASCCRCLKCFLDSVFQPFYLIFNSAVIFNFRSSFFQLPSSSSFLSYSCLMGIICLSEGIIYSFVKLFLLWILWVLGSFLFSYVHLYLMLEVFFKSIVVLSS